MATSDGASTALSRAFSISSLQVLVSVTEEKSAAMKKMNIKSAEKLTSKLIFKRKMLKVNKKKIGHLNYLHISN